MDYLHWLENHDDIADLVDDLEGRGFDASLSPGELREAFNPDFSVEEYEEALRRIHMKRRSRSRGPRPVC